MKQFARGICFLWLFTLATVQAQWFGQVGGSYDFNHNIANAQFSPDIKSDNAFSANASVGHYFQIADYTGLGLSADAGASHYLRFNGLNNAYYGGTATVKQKLGLGEFVPWLSVSGSAAHYDYEHAPRSGWRYAGGVKAGKRLSERWEIQLGYRYEVRRSDQIRTVPGLTTASLSPHSEEEEEEEYEEYPPIAGDAFNIDAHSVTLSSLFSVSERLTAHASYTRREGGLTATSLKNINSFEAAGAITEDSVFGDQRYAYRIQAGSNIYSAGLSWAINGHSVINVSYEWNESQANHGITYNNQLTHFNLLYNY